ncbi:hypothetical protein [Paraburkholderia caribensis]|uniref:hypothetical protein n=1 Tax=Paraburkholderia caribensis TaxID=75105 RepID=UPI0034D1DA7B
MESTLDEFLGSNAGTQAAAEQQTPTQTQAEQTQTAADEGSTQTASTGEQQTQTGAAEGAATGATATSATPASETATMVPLKALEEERKGRQDWKEKAIRAEAQLEALRAQPQQTQAQQSTQQPQTMTFEQALLNERMNTSETLLRQQHGDAAIDEMIESFKKQVEQNPALGAELAKQRHPYQWAFDQVKRAKAMEEIGTDPIAYRDRIKAELKAEMEAAAQASQTEQQTTQQATQTQQTPVAKPNLPQSLATARSAAPRTASVWTGPTALNDILKR